MEIEGGQSIAISSAKRTFAASFKVDPELWSRFKGVCAERGVSICHVLEALIEAWIQGQKAAATVVKPVVVNLTMQHVVDRPRRKGQAPAAPQHEDLTWYIIKFGSCYRLQPKGHYPGRIGWCRWCGQWIQGVECAQCIHSGEA